MFPLIYHISSQFARPSKRSSQLPGLLSLIVSSHRLIHPIKQLALPSYNQAFCSTGSAEVSLQLLCITIIVSCQKHGQSIVCWFSF